MSIVPKTDLLIQGLVNDVVIEVFRHFVAVDWDGPFTLMLVCDKWRELVISCSRLWTWVMVDDSQADWKDRVRIAAALSRDLPIQVVTKVSFHDFNWLLDELPHCRTVFLDTSERSHIFSRGSALITNEEFIERKDEYRELHDLLATSLSLLEHREIDAVVETALHACFTFSTWTIFERVFNIGSLKDQTKDILPRLITTLVFRDQWRKNPRRVPLQDIWPYLAALTSLKSLELSDNFIGGDKPSNMPKICLPSLISLTIDSPTDLKFRSKGGASNIFSLLHRLKAPALNSMILKGSFSQVNDAMKIPNEEITPSNLTLSFFSLGDTKEYLTVVQRPIWRSICLLTLDFFDPKWAAVTWTWMLYHHLFKAIQEVLQFLPSGCTLQIRGGEEIEHIMRLNMPSVDAIDIVYGDGQYGLTEFASSKDLIPPRIRSLTLSAGYPISYTYLRWVQSAEQVIVEAPNLDLLFEHFVDHHPGVMKALDVGNSMCQEFLNLGPMAHSVKLTSLTKLRCTAEVAMEIVMNFDTPQLVDLTLSQDGFGGLGAFEFLLDVITEYGDILLQLSTLAIEGFPPWPTLLGFVAKFNKRRGGGITSVKLPGLPHPDMLRVLVKCIREADSEYYGSESPTREPGISAVGTSPCSSCLWGGWSCFTGEECTRFSTSDLVSITKETVTDD